MHPDLEELVTHAVLLAMQQLEKHGEVPLFAAVLDQDGRPLRLNVVLDAELNVPRSVAGNAELLRDVIRKTDTAGGVFCAPILIPTDQDRQLDGIQLHADHVADPCAWLVKMPFAYTRAGGRFVGTLRSNGPTTQSARDAHVPHHRHVE